MFQGGEGDQADQSRAESGYRLVLRFSDGAGGMFDFAPFVDANTPMTAPLREPAFFARHYSELGALAWPNELDFSTGSLYWGAAGYGKAGALASAWLELRQQLPAACWLLQAGKAKYCRGKRICRLDRSCGAAQ